MTLVKWINDVVISQFQTSQDATTTNTNAVPPITLHGRTSQLNHSLGVSTSQPIKGLDLKNSSVIFASNAPLIPVAQQHTKQIVKKKVVEIEPEPKHVKLDENVLPLELLINANCDFCRYRCRVNSIRFKDTLMFQTRVYE